MVNRLTVAHRRQTATKVAWSQSCDPFLSRSGYAMLARYVLWPCVCLSVCPSQAGIVSKQ